MEAVKGPFAPFLPSGRRPAGAGAKLACLVDRGAERLAVHSLAEVLLSRGLAPRLPPSGATNLRQG